jgi:hypothetical protein
MNNLPVEIVNLIFSFVGSDTAPLIKSFVKKVEEGYRHHYDDRDEEFILDRDFYGATFYVGHPTGLLKSGKAFLFPSLDDYDEFYPEIFGDENRSGEKQIWEDFKEVGENYRKKGCNLF